MIIVFTPVGEQYQTARHVPRAEEVIRVSSSQATLDRNLRDTRPKKAKNEAATISFTRRTQKPAFRPVEPCDWLVRPPGRGWESRRKDHTLGREATLMKSYDDAGGD